MADGLFLHARLPAGEDRAPGAEPDAEAGDLAGLNVGCRENCLETHSPGKITPSHAASGNFANEMRKCFALFLVAMCLAGCQTGRELPGLGGEAVTRSGQLRYAT